MAVLDEWHETTSAPEHCAELLSRLRADGALPDKQRQWPMALAAGIAVVIISGVLFLRPTAQRPDMTPKSFDLGPMVFSAQPAEDADRLVQALAAAGIKANIVRDHDRIFVEGTWPDTLPPQVVAQLLDLNIRPDQLHGKASIEFLTGESR